MVVRGTSSQRVRLHVRIGRHPQGLTENLPSGVKGKVQQVIQQAIARILVGVDRSLTIGAKLGVLLGLQGNVAHLDGQEGLSLLERGLVLPAGRRWKVITAA